jgi:Mg-chelatase subunit ChlD
MLTHVTFVLDSSGSMNKIEEDTKGGFNSLLEEQRNEDGEATITLYEFNDHVERLFQAKSVEEVPELTDENYSPGGRTALYDAIAMAIRNTGQHISELNSQDRPDHVLVIFLTDGKENASETSQETIKELINLRQEEDEWEFLFIGANQDAVLTAKEMGMEKDRALTMSHNAEGTQAAYESTSEQISQLRQEGKTDGYAEEDRRRQEGAHDS